MNTDNNTTESGPVRVEWHGFPLFFHTNVTGWRYDVVTENEASVFHNKDAAWQVAQEHGLQLKDLQFVAVGNKVGEGTQELDKEVA